MRTRLAGIVFGVFFLSATAMAQDVFDSDGDGFDDNNDNCTLLSNVDQRDTDGDSLGNMCDPDFNNDGIINLIDLAYMRSVFLTADPHADLDGDGTVNLVDLAVFRPQFLSNPGPTATDPDQPPCDCYFSNDCNDGDPTTQLFCFYGPGSFSTEDNCVWRDIKPNGVFGAGCSIESNLTTGSWTPDICDGVCTSSGRGSTIGLEDTNLVAQAVEIWGEAMINPSAGGGGPVDPQLAEQASALQFNAQNVPIMLGRYAADVLAMSAGEPFHDYFCHFEGHPEDNNPPTVDLEGDNCRITAGQLSIQALASELQTPGTAAGIMQGITEACANWQELFTTQCDIGPGALDCATDFVEALAVFLRTPLAQPSARPDPIEQLLRGALR